MATDPSGTLYARTSGDLERRGFKVLQLNPLDFESLRREKTALFLVFPQNRVSYYALLGMVCTTPSGAGVDMRDFR